MGRVVLGGIGVRVIFRDRHEAIMAARSLTTGPRLTHCIVSREHFIIKEKVRVRPTDDKVYRYVYEIDPNGNRTYKKIKIRVIDRLPRSGYIVARYSGEVEYDLCWDEVDWE